MTKKQSKHTNGNRLSFREVGAMIGFSAPFIMGIPYGLAKTAELYQSGYRHEALGVLVTGSLIAIIIGDDVATTFANVGHSIGSLVDRMRDDKTLKTNPNHTDLTKYNYNYIF